MKLQRQMDKEIKARKQSEEKIIEVSVIITNYFIKLIDTKFLYFNCFSYYLKINILEVELSFFNLLQDRTLLVVKVLMRKSFKTLSKHLDNFIRFWTFLKKLGNLNFILYFKKKFDFTLVILYFSLGKVISASGLEHFAASSSTQFLQKQLESSPSSSREVGFDQRFYLVIVN